ncbi:MAG: winged helix-turn-helix transcriptional regulator [Betaproteobacteria bacterium]|nr:winged helix-turn-helix transcriptional regulator [Betaproteobacteria bacterium]
MTPSPARSAALTPDHLSAVFMALADPTRRAMLEALSHGNRTLTELASPFSISVPAVTKHLRILERAGLISRSRQAQKKPCALQAKPLKEAAAWIDQYRMEWEARLDRLDAFVTGLQQQEETSAASAASGASQLPSPFPLSGEPS